MAGDDALFEEAEVGPRSEPTRSKLRSEPGGDSVRARFWPEGPLNEPSGVDLVDSDRLVGARLVELCMSRWMLLMDGEGGML